jgi:ketosteroid isomerase-like protein
MSTTNGSARQTIERFLAAAVSLTPGDMADCYAERFVIEMPFATGLAPERMETTREELRARVTAGLAARRYTRATDVRIHETADPEVVVVEYRLEGRKGDDASPFSLAFVWSSRSETASSCTPATTATRSTAPASSTGYRSWSRCSPGTARASHRLRGGPGNAGG